MGGYCGVAVAQVREGNNTKKAFKQEREVRVISCPLAPVSGEHYNGSPAMCVSGYLLALHGTPEWLPRWLTPVAQPSLPQTLVP